ncbi:MAG TPA: hypothetical protein VLD84_03005 [Nitrososphaeraceae archaeon]|nr:hypothetical protein [Nitrososphaeraceae archaeon]
MDFKKSEELAYEASVSRNQNLRSKATKIEEEILKNMMEGALLFPVEDEILMTKDTASFVYKKGETYPSLMEFIGRLLHVDIPIKINQCKFGPGGVIVTANSKEDAEKILQACTNELHALIKAKKRHID